MKLWRTESLFVCGFDRFRDEEMMETDTDCLESMSDRIWGGLYISNYMEFFLRDFPTPHETSISVVWR